MPQADTKTGPTSYPYTTQPALLPLRAAAEAGDWAATRDFLDGLADEDDRSFAVSLLAEAKGAEGYLEAAAAAHTDDPLPRTLLAARYVAIGWSVRTSYGAIHVSRRQFAEFHDWLRRAETLLIEVCAEHPAFTQAWTWRLRTARGLELGQSEARRRYDRLTAHRPHDIAAARQFLQQLCPKWGGDLESVHEFARTRAAGAPPGSPLPLLVAEAHLEHYLDLPEGEQRRYVRDSAVRDELVAAGRASVLHPDTRPGFHHLLAHDTFAAVLSLGGHHAAAAPHFRALGDRYTEKTWSFLGDARAEFLKHRTTALAKG